MGLILLIILLLILFGGGVGYSGYSPGHYWGTGFYGGTGLGLIILIVVVLLLAGRL